MYKSNTVAAAMTLRALCSRINKPDDTHTEAHVYAHSAACTSWPPARPLHSRPRHLHAVCGVKVRRPEEFSARNRDMLRGVWYAKSRYAESRYGTRGVVCRIEIYGMVP